MQNGFCLVDTFFVFFFRHRIRHNAGTAPHKDFSVLFIGDPDSDTGVQISGEIDVADRTSVNAALVVFQFADELTGTDLRSPGERAGGENGFYG